MVLDFRDAFDLTQDPQKTELDILEESIGFFKKAYPKSEFVYLRNYPARDQLLVTATSFSTEKPSSWMDDSFFHGGIQTE